MLSMAIIVIVRPEKETRERERKQCFEEHLIENEFHFTSPQKKKEPRWKYLG
jgi:hypothetical protein